MSKSNVSIPPEIVLILMYNFSLIQIKLPFIRLKLYVNTDMIPGGMHTLHGAVKTKEGPHNLNVLLLQYKTYQVIVLN